MPQQETFFEQSVGKLHITVLKTYDRGLAREPFENMGSDAQTQLQTSLRIEENYNADEAPQPNDPDISDLLWDELLDAAREDGNLLSFFIVSEASGNASELLYVSADWPSAETFAKERIATAQADGGLIVN